MASTSTLTSLVKLVDVRVDIGTHTVLRGADFDVRGGEIVAITGGNGAGKSTLLDVIAGLRIPSAGDLARSGIATSFVPQQTHISPGLPVTVRDVVAIGGWGRVGLWRRLRATDRASVHQAIDTLDLTSLAQKPFAELSGGQRQRALLAQAIARGAGLLILDEPTSALDSENSARIREVIESEARRGVGIVFATHDAALRDVADRVVHVSNGRLDDGSRAQAG